MDIFCEKYDFINYIILYNTLNINIGLFKHIYKILDK